MTQKTFTINLYYHNELVNFYTVQLFSIVQAMRFAEGMKIVANTLLRKYVNRIEIIEK